MGFMDKVKAQAAGLAEKAQEGAKAGQAKLSDMQAKKHADALLLEFGGLVYAKQAGRGSADGDARAEAIFDELQKFEAENGQIAVTSAQPAPPPPAGTSYVPSSGGGDTGPPASAPSTAPADGGGIPQSSGGIPTGTFSSDTDPS